MYVYVCIYMYIQLCKSAFRIRIINYSAQLKLEKPNTHTLKSKKKSHIRQHTHTPIEKRK